MDRERLEHETTNAYLVLSDRVAQIETAELNLMDAEAALTTAKADAGTTADFATLTNDKSRAAYIAMYTNSQQCDVDIAKKDVVRAKNKLQQAQIKVDLYNALIKINTEYKP